MKVNWINYLLKWLTLFYCLFMFLYLVIFISNSKVIAGSDLVSFLTGAKTISEGKGSQIYNLNIQYQKQLQIIYPINKSNLLPFRSLPFVGLFYIPFVYIPLRISFYLILFLNIILFALSLRLLSHEFGTSKFNIFLLAIYIFYFPVVAGLTLGQNSFVIYLAVLIIYRFIIRENDRLAGFVTGLLWIKPQFLLIAPFFCLLSTKKNKYIVGFILSCVIVFLVSLCISGLGGLTGFIKFLAITESVEYGSRPYHMFTIYSLLKYVLSFTYLEQRYFQVLNFGLYALLLVYVFNQRKKFDRGKLFLIGIISTLLFSQHALVHDLIILIIPIYYYLKTNNVLQVGQAKNKIVQIDNRPIGFSFWRYRGFLVIGSLYMVPFVVLLGSVYLGTIILSIYLLTLLRKPTYLK